MLEFMETIAKLWIIWYYLVTKHEVDVLYVCLFYYSNFKIRKRDCVWTAPKPWLIQLFLVNNNIAYTILLSILLWKNIIHQS